VASVAFSQNAGSLLFQQNDTAAIDDDLNNEDVLYITIKKVGPGNQPDSGILKVYLEDYVCKSKIIRRVFFPAIKTIPELPIVAEIKKPKLLTIHGNISYDFFYESRIDTPINQQGFQQHTERVSLNILYKEKYPLKVSFVLRQSNSPFFKNFFDPVISFDRAGYSKNIKDELINTISARLMKNDELRKLLEGLQDTLKKIATLKVRLKSPATLQKIIEQKERQSNPSLHDIGIDNPKKSNHAIDSLSHSLDSAIADKRKQFAKAKSKIDTLKQDYQHKYDQEKAELDSLIAKAQQTQRKADSVKTAIERKIASVRMKVYRATSDRELSKIAGEQKADYKSSSFERQLSNVKSFSVGRAPVNYTELTAQNISLSGVNIEYNPSYYVAFAAGKIDYRFRDFFNRHEMKNNQYLVIGRLGIGNIERRAIIFSVFQGRKSIAEYRLSDSVRNYENILGYSVETILKRDADNFISAEFAKSTKPANGSLNSKQASPLLAFNDATNMGINIKAQTVFADTKTKLSGFYRSTGEQFQSFSLFSYNTNQLAWMARVDQPLLKSKVDLTLMIRSNDFTNPFAEKTYKTNTVFKSVIVNVRFPKYPFVSVGYYPGTQIYMVNNEKINETAYYILNGSMMYNYSIRRISMSSSFIYNRYFNQATDSGFILYRGINYYASQRLFLRKLQLQAGYSYTKQSLIEYSTTDLSAEYAVKDWLKFGAGLKYNQPVSAAALWGGRALLKIDMKKLGSFHFQYDKSYLPTINQSLYPIETGRVSWYKYF
jgi:flagellar biosynthesis chaperone FliJ